MKSKLLHDTTPRTFLLVFDTDDPVKETVLSFAKEHGLAGGHFKAIGAFDKATIAYWNATTKEYEPIEVDEQVEVLSMIGDLALDPSGQPKFHAHVVLGRRYGHVIGGHLVEGHVLPTLELFLQESTEPIVRKKDEATKLDLISIQDQD